MANKGYLEAAKQLQGDVSGLLERIAAAQAAVAELLVSVKAAEKDMIEKEEQERRERLERERQERLRSVLASDKDLAVHVGGVDEPEEEIVSAVEEPTAAGTAAAIAGPAPEQPVEALGANEEPEAPQSNEKPAARRSGGYEAHVIDGSAAQPARRPQQGGYQQRPQQGGYQQRPQQSGYQQRSQQGGYQQRPQQGGYQQRAQQGGGRNAAAFVAVPTPGKERVSNFDPNRSAHQRSYDTDKKAKNKKAIQKETGPDVRNWEDDGVFGNRKVKRGKQQPVHRPEPVVIEKAVITTEMISVKELSEKIGKPAAEIIKKLFLLGIMATINQEIDFDTCELIASEYNIELEQRLSKSFEEVLSDSADEADDPSQLVERPPVVTIMGHVDHGKTSLLDAIRHSGVQQTEAGGITQAIGASVVYINGHQITFIDTPGHEAFTAMRARGAQVTDIIVLVVAADDGVMPQTIEAIDHAKAADVPIVVAINKIDKPGANPERVKSELAERGVIPEEWGGSNMFVEVSAKQNLNIDELLETIILQAEVLELKANPDTTASGFVIEANLDKGRGPVATVIVQRGTLRVGDSLVAGVCYGRVRALIDPKGNNVDEAKPSDPVEILGLQAVPSAGDEFAVFEDDSEARSLAQERELKQRMAQQEAPRHVSLDDLFARIEADKLAELNLIIKADTVGSIEALQGQLDKMDQSEVRINVIHAAVGGITETDVNFAAASDAIIIGFGVRPQAGVRAVADREKVEIRLYRVIYQAIEDINAARVGLLAPEEVEVDTGSAEVREVFKMPKIGAIAGCVVTEGEIAATDKVRIVRDGVIVHDGTIASMRHYRDDVTSVKAGTECGIGITDYQDVKQGDIIEGYRIEQVARKE